MFHTYISRPIFAIVFVIDPLFCLDFQVSANSGSEVLERVLLTVPPYNSSYVGSIRHRSR
jgi:hypothetical protein